MEFERNFHTQLLSRVVLAVCLLVFLGCSSKQSQQGGSSPMPPSPPSGSTIPSPIPSPTPSPRPSPGQQPSDGQQGQGDSSSSGSGGGIALPSPGIPSPGGGSPGSGAENQGEEQSGDENSSDTGSTGDPGSVSTGEDELLTDLERELDESLTVFDTQVQDARSNAATGTSSSEIPEEESGVTKDDTDEVAGDSPSGDSDMAQGPGNLASGNVLPADQGSEDWQDDDIVARQLREAAVAETDPALKEKLWEEYRRYKKGSDG